VKKFIIAGLAALGGLTLASCTDSDANVVSENISTEADNFKINRRIVAFNGITDKYLLSVEGWCNLTDEGDQLEIVCKVGDERYKKHFVGLSDNVSYFAEQLESANVSASHYKVVFKPSTILPDVEVR
jgi:hypothetical protein